MKIEIWSDFICPFCYIGKRRLEAAIEKFPHHEKIFIEFKSYELNHSMEKNINQNIHEFMASKYNISIEEAKEKHAHIGKLATEVGLSYKFETMKPTNTFDAHRLTKYAEKHDLGNEMTER